MGVGPASSGTPSGTRAVTREHEVHDQDGVAAGEVTADASLGPSIGFRPHRSTVLRSPREDLNLHPHSRTRPSTALAEVQRRTPASIVGQLFLRRMPGPARLSSIDVRY
jgi:hypothetical protein